MTKEKKMKKILLIMTILSALSSSIFAKHLVEIGPFKTMKEALAYKKVNSDQGQLIVQSQGSGQIDCKTIIREKTYVLLKIGFVNHESAQDFIDNFNLKNAVIKNLTKTTFK